MDSAPQHRWRDVPKKKVQAVVKRAVRELPQLDSFWATPASWALAAYIRDTDTQFMAEVAGLARTAEVPTSTLLLLNLAYDLSSCYAHGLTVGCTATAHRDAQGTLRVLRALDWGFPSGIGEYTSIFRLHARGRELHLVGFPGFVGAVTGYATRSGVFGALNQAFTDAHIAPAVPAPWLLRDSLWRGASLSEAARSVTTRRAASPAFYLLADSARALAISSTGAEDTVYPLTGWANHFPETPRGTPVAGDSHARAAAAIRAANAADYSTARRAYSRYPLLNADTAHLVVCAPGSADLRVTRAGRTCRVL